MSKITKQEVRNAYLQLEEASLKLEYLKGNTSGVNRLIRQVQTFLDRVEAEAPEPAETTAWTPEEILAREG